MTTTAAVSFRRWLASVRIPNGNKVYLWDRAYPVIDELQSNLDMLPPNVTNALQLEDLVRNLGISDDCFDAEDVLLANPKEGVLATSPQRRRPALPRPAASGLTSEWHKLAADWQALTNATGPYRLWPDPRWADAKKVLRPTAWEQSLPDNRRTTP